MYKPVIAALASYIPLRIMNLKNGLPPILPFYHTVSNDVVPFINSYPIRNEARFEREIDYLLRHFIPVDLNTIINKPAKNQMHLSFDDGLKSCHTTIAPILERKGIPATFFVSPAFADNKNLFHRFKRGFLENLGVLAKGGKPFYYNEISELDSIAAQNDVSWAEVLDEFRPYMGVSEIASLQNRGFTIGAHSTDHPEFYYIDEKEQFRQVSESVGWVKQNFKPAINAFAFPFTDDGVKLSLFERLRMENVCDVTFGTAGLKHDMAENHFQRIPIEHRNNWDARKVVHFEFFYYFVRSLFNKNVVAR